MHPLPTLMYGCGAWALTDGTLHKLNTVWNNCFDEFSHVAEEKALGHYSFIVNLCQYRPIFCLTNGN